MEHIAIVQSVKKNLEAIKPCKNEPVLLEGPTGSGKTTLVEYLAYKLKKTLVKVQLGEQSDSKSVLGTYCCSEIPGQFYWRNSAILEAMLNGHWLLLEDLDQSPVDVLGVLLPLLESRSLLVPGLGNERVEAKEGFRMFATSRLLETPSGYSRIQTNPQFNIVANLFLRIIVEPMNKDEMIEAIMEIFSFAKNDTTKLVEVYQELVKNEPIVIEAREDDTSPKYCTSRMKQYTIRDLIKWCQRIHKVIELGMPKGVDMTKDMVIPDAFDIFAASVSQDSGKLEAHKRVVKLIGVNQMTAEKQCLNYQAIVKVTEKKVEVGRHTLLRQEVVAKNSRKESPKFAYTRQTSCLLEGIAGSVLNSESVLLVGETGTGKTSTVQYLAHVMNVNLRVVNMNQQSDSSDLLGAYRPMDVKKLVRPLWERYNEVFAKSVAVDNNKKFLQQLDDLFLRDKFMEMFAVMKITLPRLLEKFTEGHALRSDWVDISQRIAQLETLVEQCRRAPAFSFVEGALVQAIKNGDWILLDEINLATAETLESLCGLLESVKGSVTLADRGDHEPIKRHPNFRLFACMNPALDVGKKDLPISLRSRFTEFYVDEIVDTRNLSMLIHHYLQGTVRIELVEGIVRFYQEMRKLSSHSLSDGVGRSPHFSMRTLCRALMAAGGTSFGELSRSIYEGFCVSFLTQLDRKSYNTVKSLIDEHILLGKPLKNHPHNMPPKLTTKLIECQGYLILKGDLEPNVDESYILTPSVENNLKDLARGVAARGLPILLQGETSVGKTSMITYLAKATGNRCYRINNHEHTDVQEYIGTYAADANGQLVFKEGTLVNAMRKGYWIILDELNLAPTEVLEALNRLLDDNRELFIPETQETIKAHERFLVFATQNPAGLYGGRKVLSRAFRNRFVELHFDEIPRDELESILHKRTNISPSHSKKLVNIMQELQRKRKNSSLFSGKQGFITLRELFRWAERYNRCTQEAGSGDKDWDQIFANQGYFLLAAKVRQDSEEETIRQVIKTHLKKDIDTDNLYASVEFMNPVNNITEQMQQSSMVSLTTTKDKKELRKIKKQMRKEHKVKDTKGEANSSSNELPVIPGFEHVVMTKAMKRMAVLVSEAIKHKEPVLLVGETGCGKTTICQMLAKHQGLELLTLNCHLHTETSDFLGGLRPVRHREENSNRLFEWRDGPLITAMKGGDMFLVDEISLADDSVLERLNSVLEPERKLLLVEKGGEESDDSEEIVASEKFLMVATMNPGGDFGKKELSPALRNRFTEIWCPLSREAGDWTRITEHNLKLGLPRDAMATKMSEFVNWMMSQMETRRIVVSIRDLLSWTAYINATALTNDLNGSSEVTQFMPSELAYIHGALMVFVDALQTDQQPIKDRLLNFLCEQVGYNPSTIVQQLKSISTFDINGDQFFTMGPFKIPRGPKPIDQCQVDFAFHAPTTSSNAVRVMRALQLHRPILLEGSPGVGKTSLVLALAKASGRNIVRINLSDQTDVSDLFGADLPIDGGKCGEFQWVDGPLLAGLKAGHWIVLDELNLATQSVLEGLNACFDHRSEVFIPELSQTFHIDHQRTRIFACQNPVVEGGDRKGLPKSFLNRFTQVYVDQLSFNDLIFILHSLHPDFPEKSLVPMVTFNQMMHKAINQEKRFGQVGGGAWDFNLRDLLRWCQLCIENGSIDRPGRYVDVIYMMRLRTNEDRVQAEEIFERVFSEKYNSYIPSSDYLMTNTVVQIGNSFLKRSLGKRSANDIEGQRPLRFLQSNARAFASLIECLNMNWMAILVGPSGCGKSSLLNTLSHLSGRELHSMSMNANMDTTELLGSFEQASFRKKIKSFVEKYSEVIRDMDEGGEFKQLWTYFIQSQKAIVEEKETIGKSAKGVEILMNMENILSNYQANEAITDLMTDVISMHKSCSEVECGKFEWVDSLLLTCMKKGHWIVLDNINFCSSSVLDRLNGVLEPNGKLRLDELGSDAEGRVPEITPHPDFRLFLTMDPKNGDISRAMRNRGIEISMTSLKGPNDEDLVSLVNDTGITPAVVRSVINFHRAAREDPEMNSEVSTLVRACRLVQMRMEDESKVSIVERRQILSDAFHLTYINGCHDNRLKKKLTELVETTLSEHFSLTNRVTVIPLPGLNSWLKNINASILSKASVLLRRILYSAADINVLPGTEIIKESDLNVSLALMISSIIAAQSNSTKSLKLLPSHIEKHVNKKQLASNENLVLCTKNIINTLSYLSDHPLVKLFSVTLGTSNDKNQLPMNIFRNPAYIHFSNLSEESIMILHNIYKQIPILFNCNMIGSELKKRIDSSKPITLKHGANSSQTFNFIQFAKSHSLGLIHRDSLPHPVLPQLVHYLKLTIEEIEKSLEASIEWSDENLTNMSEGLCWLKALMASLSEDVSGRQLSDEKMMDASLLAKWTNKKFGAVFDNNFSANHVNLVSALRTALDFDGRVDKFHGAAISAFGRAAVFKNQSDAEAYLTIKSLQEKYFAIEEQLLSGNFIKLKDIAKWLRFLSNEVVVKAKWELAVQQEKLAAGSNLSDEMKSVITETESVLDKEYKAIFTDLADDSEAIQDNLNGICSELSTTFQMIPIRSYFMSNHSALSLHSLLKSSPTIDEGFSKLAELAPGSSLSNNFSNIFGIASSNHHFDSVKFQLIGTYLRSLQSNLTSKSLPYLIGSLEMVKPRVKQDDEEEMEDMTANDFDCGIIRQARNETKSNLFSGFSNFVFELIDPGRKISSQSDLKDSDSSCSWLLSAVQLKLASKKLQIVKSLESHVWTYLANQEMDAWNNIKNNLMILEHCMQLVTSCLSQLSSVLPSDNILEKLYTTAQQQLQNAKISSSKTDLCSVGVAIGVAWLCLGQLQLRLLCPREGSVDEVRKVSIRLAGVKSMIKEANLEIELRRTNKKIHGDSTDDDEIERLKSHLDELNIKKEKLMSKLAYRPVPSQYPELCRELVGFTRDHFNPEQIFKFIEDLLFSFYAFQQDKSNSSGLSSLMAGIKTFHGRVLLFSRRFERSFHIYPDETSGIISALRQCEFGLDSIICSITIDLEKTSLSKDLSIDVDKLTSSLSVFPITTLNCPDLCDLADLFMSKDFLLMMKRFEEKNGSQCLINRILKASSMLLLNSSESNHNSSKLYNLLNTVASTYHSRWHKQEEEKRKREEEEASLFKFKTIGSTMTEDETDAMEILRDFPTFSEDFEDFAPSNQEQPKPTIPSSSSKPSNNIISDEDLDHFVSVYLNIMSKDESDESSNKETTVDWFSYWNLMHQVTSEVLKDSTHLVNPEIERNLISNHLMALCFVRQSLENPNVLESTKKILNVYKDADIGNSTRCLQVLENLLKEVKSYLVQWPEHPTLIHLIVIIDRILTFPVSSPPMKFIRGLEIVLETAQLWVERAPKHLSMISQLEDVTKLVKTWRGMELSGWKASLDGVEDETRRKSCKWWYHMYSILQSQLKDINCGKSKELTKDTKLTILRSLEELMENSPIGEFQCRLKIVLSFHRYLGHLVNEVTKENCKGALKCLANIFYGVFEHYHQFLASIKKALVELREPVEKDLKDHIKIITRSKDHDTNYFSVRSLCHKSHKTIHKFTKKYRLHLQQPVRPMLVDKYVDWQIQSEENIKPSIKKRSMSKKASENEIKQSVACNLSAEMFNTDIQSQNAQQHLKKMMMFSKKIINQSTLKKSINELNLFTGEVLESIQYLEALKPATGASKERRIKELKRIQNMKRKALTDLFKSLRNMGLSHKKGLAHHDSLSPEEVFLNWFEANPTPSNIIGLGNDQSEPREFLANQIKKLKNYLTKCFSRRSMLMALLTNHNKDLDAGCLDRSKGYCEHLHIGLLKQRESLTTSLETYQKLRLYLNDLSDITANVPNQNVAKKWKVKVKQLFRQSKEYLQQLYFFVDTVASTSNVEDEDKVFISLVTTENVDLNRSHYLSAKDLIKNCLSDVDAFDKHEVDNKNGTLIKNLSGIEASFDKLSQLSQNLQSIANMLSLIKNSSEGVNESTASPRILIGLIETSYNEYKEFSKTYENGEISEDIEDNHIALEQLDGFKVTCQSLSTSCLKGVERLVKDIQLYKDKPEESKETMNDDNDDDDDDENIVCDNLIEKINSDALKCVEDFNLNKVTNHLASLVNTISNWSTQKIPTNHMKEVMDSVSEVRDVIMQYGRLAQFLIILKVSGLKEVSKLQSVLLRLFSELAEKGFCTPPELSEEEDNSKGAQGTKFEDIEEGGMGDGDGIKDVSDEIDNEGQIEGLQSDKPEDKKDDKKEKDDDEEDNAIEMSNDFEGELEDPRKKEQGEDEDAEDEDGVDESEIEKQMGDVGDTGEEEKLDEKMWGDDEEEEDSNSDNKKDDHGKGTNADSELELGAKGAQEGDDQGQKEGEDNGMEEDDEGTEKDAEHIPDMSEYDEETEKKASKDGQNDEENTDGDDLEIPEDLKIEDDGKAEGEDALPEDNPSGDDSNEKERTNDDDQMEIDDESPPSNEEEIEEGKEIPADDSTPDLDANKDDMEENTNDNFDGLQAPPIQDQTMNEKDEDDNENEDIKEDKESMKRHHEGDDTQGVNADTQDTAAQAQVDARDDKQNPENQGRNLGKDDSAQQDDSANKIMSDNSTDNKKENRKRQRDTNEERSLGDANEKSSKRLKTVDSAETEEYKSNEEDKPKEQNDESTNYSHMKNDSTPHDAQVIDAATKEQLEKFQQPVSMETEESFQPDQETELLEDEPPGDMDTEETPELHAKNQKMNQAKNDKQKQKDNNEKDVDSKDHVDPKDDPRELVNLTNWVSRGTDSYINRPLDSMDADSEKVDVDLYRRMVEEELANINRDLIPADSEDQSEWSRYESATSHLSQDLCEQLRLILEPTQASKLRGDYKTGKRISMRKVIQYIASQFRKDRIWLRRTRPCKRQYQIMLAIDDSESMKSNGLRELTLESVAIIMNALSKLEVGNVGVCSFGKEVSVLHPMGKPFTNQCGGDLIKNLKFEQVTTDFVQMINTSTGLFSEHNQSNRSNDGSLPHQLLLIVSDGGIRNSAEWTRPAVKYARERGIFIVCIIVDNPETSIFDVMAAIFNGPGNVELRPAMDTFPIPFYSVVRDAKNLPQTLADSLRQWFEMTTA